MKPEFFIVGGKISKSMQYNANWKIESKKPAVQYLILTFDHDDF